MTEANAMNSRKSNGIVRDEMNLLHDTRIESGNFYVHICRLPSTDGDVLFIYDLQNVSFQMINFFVRFSFSYFSASNFFLRDADHFDDCHNECARSDRNGRTCDAKYKNISRTSRINNNPMAKAATQPQYHNNPFVFKCELTTMQKLSVSKQWLAKPNT